MKKGGWRVQIWVEVEATIATFEEQIPTRMN